jgi:hypothetical protein
MDIKFLLKECIYCNVDRKGRAARASRPELVIEIETARTLREELYL